MPSGESLEHLYVKTTIMDGISMNNSNVASCMLQLVEKWLGHDNGTGNLPRTWQTVVQAVKHTGKGLLAEQLTEQHEVHLLRSDLRQTCTIDSWIDTLFYDSVHGYMGIHKYCVTCCKVHKLYRLDSQQRRLYKKYTV